MAKRTATLWVWCVLGAVAVACGDTTSAESEGQGSPKDGPAVTPNKGDVNPGKPEGAPQKGTSGDKKEPNATGKTPSKGEDAKPSDKTSDKPKEKEPADPTKGPSDKKEPGDKGDKGPTHAGAGKVACGPNVCDLSSDICCMGFGLAGAEYACMAPTACKGLKARALCDGPDDCKTGVCCAGFPAGASCKKACEGQEMMICQADSDCADGKTCKECGTPGDGPKFRFCVKDNKCPFG